MSLTPVFEKNDFVVLDYIFLQLTPEQIIRMGERMDIPVTQGLASRILYYGQVDLGQNNRRG